MDIANGFVAEIAPTEPDGVYSGVGYGIAAGFDVGRSKTGYPADAGLISVTVTAPTGLLSDALSTACFVLGYEKSLPLLESFDAQAIFVTKEKAVRVTSGLAKTFQLTNGAYHLIQDT